MKLKLLLPLLLFIGCKAGSPVCEIQGKVEDGMAVVISTALSCHSDASIKSDLNKVFSKIPICTGTKVKLDGAICTMLVNGAVDAALGAGVPTSWKCDNKSTSLDVLKSALTNTCSKIIPI